MDKLHPKSPKAKTSFNSWEERFSFKGFCQANPSPSIQIPFQLFHIFQIQLSTLIVIFPFLSFDGHCTWPLLIKLLCWTAAQVHLQGFENFELIRSVQQLEKWFDKTFHTPNLLLHIFQINARLGMKISINIKYGKYGSCQTWLIFTQESHSVFFNYH